MPTLIAMPLFVAIILITVFEHFFFTHTHPSSDKTRDTHTAHALIASRQPLRVSRKATLAVYTQLDYDHAALHCVCILIYLR